MSRPESWASPSAGFVALKWLAISAAAYSILSSCYLLARYSGSQDGFDDVPPSPFSSLQPKFTVVISTHLDSPRPCFLGQWLPLEDVVEEIIVVWDNPAEGFIDSVKRREASNFTVPVRFLTDFPNASLNNRYKIHEQIRTDAVFAIDDAIRIRHVGVRAAFVEWKRHPDLMINFWPQNLRHSANGTVYNLMFPRNSKSSGVLGLTARGEHTFLGKGDHDVAAYTFPTQKF